LNKPVEIYRDSNGVAHIYGETTEDLFFAQGYVHAQERFWQMEFQRRVGSGRLSEIIGDATLDTDIYIRTMGFRHLAEQRGIPYQYEILPRGGTDAGAMQRIRAGVPVITLSTPTRYVHTSMEMVHKSDLEASVNLMTAFLEAGDSADLALK
jgi:putative aminopeptidase FrvX